jgi:hypothetical protein
MRVGRLILSFVLIILVSSPRLNSQQAIPAPQRDPQAVAAIQNALAAMGGASAIAQVQTVIAQGSMLPAQGSAIPSGNFTMEDQFTGQAHEFKDAFQSPAITQTLASGHGNPGLLSNGHTKNLNPWSTNSRLPVHLPAIILSGLLANANCNITSVGQATINGQAAIQVHFHIDTDIVQQTLSIQDWYFDPATSLPIRVEYRIPDTSNPTIFISAAADFSDFRPVQGVLFPFRLLAYQDARPQAVLTLTSVAVNQPISSSDFDVTVAVAQ